ncbi:MAG: hypothetical protein L0227_09805 [Chloroflexi bacterium]|nr:hypothetical protein [Chloroflexota bacterium]
MPLDELLGRYHLARAAVDEIDTAGRLDEGQLQVVALAIAAAADPRLGLTREQADVIGRVAVETVLAARDVAERGVPRRGDRERRRVGSGACHGFLGRLARREGGGGPPRPAGRERRG